MRWSIIRLIWLRELRDQLRDRRTVFMIVGLPILLYPILGLGVLELAGGLLKQQTVVGIYNEDALPRPTPRGLTTAMAAASWYAATPDLALAGPGRLAGLAALLERNPDY